ncbi:histidine kinase dimerization/phospho-acceptor domain-containing protein [Streptomyces sp. PmtG]
MLRAIPLGALLVGDDGRIVASNPQFAEICGLRDVDTSTGAPADPVADAVARLLPDASASSLRTLRGQFVRKAEVRLKDGRTLRRSRQPIDAGERHLGVLWLVEDVTEQIRYEADLHRHIDTLNELARERAEFAARTSHELRTPLSTMLTFCELLTDPGLGARSTRRGASTWTRSGARPPGCGTWPTACCTGTRRPRAAPRRPSRRSTPARC